MIFRVTKRGVKYPKASRGLGDDVRRLTEATGIATVVKRIEKATGRRCWCDAVQAWLNSRFPKKR